MSFISLAGGHDILEEEHGKVIEERDMLRERLLKKEEELETLKTSNLFLGAIFNGISEEIMVVDAEFNVKKVNRTFL